MDGYPYAKLKVNVDEALVAGVVERLGGARFDGTRTFPEGVKPVDFILTGYALEYKALDEDPLISQPDRPAKITDFLAQKVATGELKIEGNEVHLTGPVSQEYWRKFLGVSVGRQLEKAAKQIRSTRAFLGNTELKGAVMVVNAAAPFIDGTSFANMVQVQQRRPEFADAINVAIYFSCIVGLAEGRPALAIGFTPEGAGHDDFCQKLLGELMKTVAGKLGKSAYEPLAHDQTIHPLRVPFSFHDGSGHGITFH